MKRQKKKRRQSETVKKEVNGREMGDRGVRLGWKAVISSEYSPISRATQRSEAQVLASTLFLSRSLSFSHCVPPLPAAVYFKPFPACQTSLKSLLILVTPETLILLFGL